MNKDYQSAEKEWLEAHGESDSAKEIRNIQQQLRDLQG